MHGGPFSLLLKLSFINDLPCAGVYNTVIRRFLCISHLDSSERILLSLVPKKTTMMKVSSINFPISQRARDVRMWPCQSIRVQHWLFEWQQPILLDYAARSSACIVSDEAMISECSVDAYAHELSALTIVHTYSARSKKCSGYYRAPHEIIGIFRSILRPSLHCTSSSPSHESCALTLSIVQRLSFCNNEKEKSRVCSISVLGHF